MFRGLISYVWGLDFLRLGVSNSYVRVMISYDWGLVILMFWG